MVRLFCAALIYVFMAGAAAAQSAAPIDALYRVLGLDDIMGIMREEGLSYGADMQEQLLGGRGGDRWSAAVSQIYDVTLMREVVRSRMDIELAAEDLAPMIAFFSSKLGLQIISLEVSARRALLEDGVEDLSREAFEALERDADPRAALIKDLVASAELVDSNVVSALNSNFAFFSGLASGGGRAGGMSEDEILADVWGQETEIRADTTAWLHGYLNLAYQPLSDDDLQRYIDFYESDAGQVLNRAVFQAFDEVFSTIGYALGQSAAIFMAGEEL